MLDPRAGSHSIRMDQIRPKTPPILGNHRIQSQMGSISVQTNSLTGGKTRSKLSPSFSKSSVVHQDKIESSLMSASTECVTYQDVSFDKLEMLSLDRGSDNDGRLGCYQH